MKSLSRIALLLGALATPGVQAQPAATDGNTAYRCANGSYSSLPCPGGTQLEVADPRTPGQQQQARDTAAREARLAKQLAAERRLRDKEVAAQQAINIGPETTKPPQPAASKPTDKGKKTQKQPGAKAAKSGQAVKATKGRKNTGQ